MTATSVVTRLRGFGRRVPPFAVALRGRPLRGGTGLGIAAFLAAIVATGALAPRAWGRTGDHGRVGVLRFDGSSESPVRRQVQRALGQRGFEIVGAQALQRTADQSDFDLSRNGDRRRLMAKLRLTALVLGDVKRQGSRSMARLTIEPREGTSEGETWTVRGGTDQLAEAVGHDLLRRAGTVLGKPARRREGAAGVEEPEAAATQVASEAPVEPAAPTTPADPGFSPHTRRPAFELFAGPRFLSRRLSFDGDERGELRDHRTRSLAQALGIGAAWFPFAAQPGAVHALGFEASYERGLGLRSITSDGTAYESPHQQFAGAFLWRVPRRWVTGDALLGGGTQRFGFDRLGAPATDPDERPPVPDVSYSYLRAGLRMVFHTTGAFALIASGAYRHVLDAGPIAGSQWFPGASAWGFDATVGALYRLHPQWEIRAEADVRRYAHGFSADPGAALVASGAIDLYVDYLFSLAFVWDRGGVRAP